MKSLLALTHLKSEKLKMILRKDKTTEFIQETATADPKFMIKTINEANRKKISRLKFIRTHFKGTSEEWSNTFNYAYEGKKYLQFFDFSTCSFDDAAFIDPIMKYQDKMKIVYNPTINTLERMQNEEYMKMFFKIKIIKPGDKQLVYKSRFNAKSFFFLIMQASRLGMQEAQFCGVKKLEDYVDPDFYTWDDEFKRFEALYQDEPCKIINISFKGYQPV